MRTAVLALFAAVALFAAPTVASAGGGSKPNSIIKVKNNSGGTILVILADQKNSLTNLDKLFSDAQSNEEAPSVSEVQSAAAKDGAKVITVNNKATGTFAGLQAGTYQLIVADVDDGAVGADFVNQLPNSTVAKGKTVTVTVGPQSSSSAR